MSDDTRARQAAAGPDVSVDGWHWWRTPWGADIIRYWYAGPDEWSDGLDADMIATGWVYRGPVLPPAAIEARDAEIARLREALERIADAPTDDADCMCSAGDTCDVARAALAPPPASDGECCHRTRLRGAPCPAGRTCPHDAPAPAGWDEGTCNR